MHLERGFVLRTSGSFMTALCVIHLWFMSYSFELAILLVYLRVKFCFTQSGWKNYSIHPPFCVYFVAVNCSSKNFCGQTRGHTHRNACVCMGRVTVFEGVLHGE